MYGKEYLEAALAFIDRNSMDGSSDLIFNSDGDSYILFKCPELLDKDVFCDEFVEEWNTFINQYSKELSEYYEADDEEEHVYDVTPEFISMKIEKENNSITINLYIPMFQVYGYDIPDLLGFGNDIDAFVKRFINKDKYKECTYESVITCRQDYGVCTSSNIDLFSNIENNTFEYSFNRLLPIMLEELKRQWIEDVYDIEDAKMFVEEVSELEWIPEQWYEELVEITKNPEYKALILAKKRDNP